MGVLLNWDRCVETLKRGELITEREVKELCYRARDILVEESNVQRVAAPVTVRACLRARGQGRSGVGRSERASKGGRERKAAGDEG